MNKKIIDKVKTFKSIIDLHSVFSPEAVNLFRRVSPEIKNYIDGLLKGNFTIKTDPPYRKLVKINFKVDDFSIETEDGYVDIYLYVDLLVPKNLSEEDKLFVGRWVQSYNQDDPVDAYTNDSYFNDRDVWIRIVKVNGGQVDIPNFIPDYPEDKKLFDLFNIPYENNN